MVNREILKVNKSNIHQGIPTILLLEYLSTAFNIVAPQWDTIDDKIVTEKCK